VDGGIGGLERMKNLGPVSAARLRAVGIETPDQLRQVGPVEAYVRLKRAFPIETTQIALYTLHGAITDAPWYVLSDEVKAALRDAAARRLSRQSGD
jgi:DNA transformation protein and related proteins